MRTKQKCKVNEDKERAIVKQKLQFEKESKEGENLLEEKQIVAKLNALFVEGALKRTGSSVAIAMVDLMSHVQTVTTYFVFYVNVARTVCNSISLNECICFYP